MENLQIWNEIWYEIERFSEGYRFQDLDEKCENLPIILGTGRHPFIRAPMLVASIRETHSKWRRTRNGCVATRGTQKNIAIRNSSHSEWLAIQTGSLGGVPLG